jgi:hypothetical protein
MSANTTPIFVGTPRIEAVRINAANTAKDGSGTIVTAFTAGTNGSRIDAVTFLNAPDTPATNSAGVWRIFIRKNSSSPWTLLQETTTAAVASSNTVVGALVTNLFTYGLNLPAEGQIGVTQSVYAGTQDQTDVIVRGGDF